MTTIWNADEYARVAVALLYPPSSVAVVIIGFAAASAYPIAWQLLGRLQQLDEPAKARALTQADRVEAARVALEDSVTQGDPDVTQVSRISLDSEKGYRLRLQNLRQMREFLGSIVDWYINPNAAQSTGGGGVNGTCY